MGFADCWRPPPEREHGPKVGAATLSNSPIVLEPAQPRAASPAQACVGSWVASLPARSCDSHGNAISESSLATPNAALGSIQVLRQDGGEMAAFGVVSFAPPLANGISVSMPLCSAPRVPPRAVLRIVSLARVGMLPAAAIKQLVHLSSTAKSVQHSYSTDGRTPCGDSAMEHSVVQQLKALEQGTPRCKAIDVYPQGAGFNAESQAWSARGHSGDNDSIVLVDENAASYLQPMHINQTLKQAVNVKDPGGYADLLQELLVQDGALLTLIKDIAAELARGHARSVLHVPAAAVGHPPAVIIHGRRQLQQQAPFRVIACYHRAPDGALEPAIVLEHAMGSSSGGDGGAGGNGEMAGATGHLLDGGGSGSLRGISLTSRSMENSRSMQLGTGERRQSDGTSAGNSVTSLSASALAVAGTASFRMPVSPSNITLVGRLGSSYSTCTGPSPRRTLLSSVAAPAAAAAVSCLGASGATSMGSPSDLTDMCRGFAMLSHCPHLTLMEFSGAVLFQNEGSCRYWGNITSQPAASRSGAPFVTTAQLLDQLFALQPQWQETALAEARAGGKWQRILQVPASSRSEMQRQLRSRVQTTPAVGLLVGWNDGVRNTSGGRLSLGGNGTGWRRSSLGGGLQDTSQVPLPQAARSSLINPDKDGVTRGAKKAVTLVAGEELGSPLRASSSQLQIPQQELNQAPLPGCPALNNANSGNVGSPLPWSPAVARFNTSIANSTTASFNASLAGSLVTNLNASMPGSTITNNFNNSGAGSTSSRVHYNAGSGGSSYIGPALLRSNSNSASLAPTSPGLGFEGLPPRRARHSAAGGGASSSPLSHSSSPPLALLLPPSSLPVPLVSTPGSTASPNGTGGGFRMGNSGLYLSNSCGEGEGAGGRGESLSRPRAFNPLTEEMIHAHSMELASKVMSRSPSRHVMAFVTKAASNDKLDYSLTRNGSNRPKPGSGTLTSEVFKDMAEVDEEEEQSEGCGLSFDDSEEDDVAWHELELTMMLDPVTGQEVLLVLQEDVTQRAVLEHQLSALMEAQFSMLEQMFPRHAMEYLLENELRTVPENLGQLANIHETVTILFTDIVGFTSMSKVVTPAQVMDLLNNLFTLFDELAHEFSVYKVETAGDCYIVAGGLTEEDEDGFTCIAPHDMDPSRSAHRVLAFGKALQLRSRSISMPHDGTPVQLRVGIHTGPVVTGVIGLKLPKFSVFGTTMNTASRMESTCQVGCLQVSETTMQLLKDDTLVATGGVEVKGLGLMETYLWRAPTTGAAVAAALTALDDVAVQLSTTTSTALASVRDDPLRSSALMSPSRGACSSPSPSPGGMFGRSRPCTRPGTSESGMLSSTSIGASNASTSAAAAAAVAAASAGGGIAGTTLWNAKDENGNDDMAARRRLMLIQGYGAKTTSQGIGSMSHGGRLSRPGSRGNALVSAAALALAAADGQELPIHLANAALKCSPTAPHSPPPHLNQAPFTSQTYLASQSLVLHGGE